MSISAQVAAQIAAQIEAGASAAQACFRAGVSEATWRRRKDAAVVQEAQSAGQQAVADLVRGADAAEGRRGRKPMVVVSAAEQALLRRLYVQTNRSRGMGSMTMAARMLARDPATRTELAEAILKPRASKHGLPVEVRRAMRGLGAAVALHRDPDALALGGIYTPGCLRMVREDDGTLRRLRPGERQSWDDASINFPVCTPWPWGGDKCSDRWKVRIGRFQLLACVDDATDFCPGFSYTIRGRDSYRGEDVVAAMYRLWRDAYRPERCMMEGGAWQSKRAMAFMERSGVAMDDAKGRPHSKLVESYWNRLWTVLSVYGGGQIGRYRGEMAAENDIWIDCQQGRKDPRKYFLMLPDALNAIAQAIGYLNTEQVESKLYGRWVPAEMHAQGMAERPLLPLQADDALSCLAWPVYAQATVRRGMVRVTADTPAGGRMPYHFSGVELYAWDGAPVRVSFDPWAEDVLAVVALDRAWRDAPEGTIVARGLSCMDAFPRVAQDACGAWGVTFADGAAAADRAKRMANGAVRREVRVLGLDGRQIRTAHTEDRAPHGLDRQATVGGAPVDGVAHHEAQTATPKVLSRWEMLDDVASAG